MVTSRYIQLADWLLLEYSYTANAPDSLNYPAVPMTVGDDYAGVYRITNNFTETYQFANKGVPVNGKHVTGNCLDWSAIPVDKKQNKWAILNVSGSGNTPFDEYDELILEDLDDQSGVIYYDTCKLHILSGYNFEGLDGFALDVIFKEIAKKDFKAASFCYSADLTTQTLTLNPNPVLLGEKMYDKYVEFNVPALKYIQDEYWLDPSYAENFAYNFTHPTTAVNTSPGGYVKDSPVFFELREFVNVETIDDIDYFDVKNTYSASITQADNFSSLGCVIKESDNGDYFEYYPTWQDTFIDNYVDTLNSSGDNDWTVINEIRVFEQIGVNTKQTAQIIQFQNESYDTPNYFRPIITNAANAFAFTIYYVMKFFNKASAEQIIRTGTITSYEPKKYGLGLKKIDIEDGIAPLKVYNKVINLKRLSNNTAIGKPMPVTTKYVNVFNDRSSIAVNASINDVKEDGTIFYGQGELLLYLTKFDNVVNIKVVKISQGAYVPVNLSQLEIYMNFIYDNEQTVSVQGDITSAESGEVSFTIKRDVALQILKQKKDDNFYIVVKSGTSSLETVLYTGKYKNLTNGAGAGTGLSNSASNAFYNSKIPLLDYINSMLNKFKDCEATCTAEHAKLESERTKLAQASRLLQDQLSSILKIADSLPAATQAQVKNSLPSSIAKIDFPSTDTTAKVDTSTVVADSSSDNQPIVEDTVASDGKTPNQNVNSSSDSDVESTDGSIKLCN